MSTTLPPTSPHGVDAATPRHSESHTEASDEAVLVNEKGRVTEKNFDVYGDNNATADSEFDKFYHGTLNTH